MREEDQVMLGFMVFLALWGLTALGAAYRKGCAKRKAFENCCDHDVYFNKLDPHGRYGRTTWLQRTAYKCCWCGRLWSHAQGFTQITPTYETEADAKFHQGIE
jgi:hypothetical protein